MKAKKIFTVVIILTLFCSAIIPTFAFVRDAETDSFSPITLVSETYNVRPGSKEWSMLKTAEERRKACFISSEECAKMSTSTLAKTVLFYPLLIDIRAYDTLEQGIKVVASYCPGLKELLSRDDALDILFEFSNSDSQRTETTNICFFLADDLIHYLLFSVPTTKGTPTTVYTPLGTPVSATYNRTWADHETSYTAQKAYCNAFLYTYTTASLIAPPQSDF